MPGSLVPLFREGTGAKPVPNGGAAARGRRGRAACPHGSRVADRDRNEAGPLVRLHAHQDASLTVALSVSDRLAHVGRRRYRLAVDVQNDVAGLELVARGAARIDLSDHDALPAIAGRRERQAKLRHVDPPWGGALLGVGARLTIPWQFA